MQHWGKEELELASGSSFDAIVLDVLPPVFSGFEVCQRLREQGSMTSILMLTCRTATKTSSAAAWGRRVYDQAILYSVAHRACRCAFDLLHFLIQNPGRAFTREMILATVWGGCGHHTLNVVDV